MLTFYKSQNGALFLTDGWTMVIKEGIRVSIRRHHNALDVIHQKISPAIKQSQYDEMLVTLKAHYEESGVDIEQFDKLKEVAS